MVRIEVFARGQYLRTMYVKNRSIARTFVRTLPEGYKGLLIY